MLGVLSFLGKARRGSPGVGARRRKTTRRCRPLVEAAEQACCAIEAGVSEAMLPPAVVVEALEERTHLTTFNAFISGPSSGTHGPPDITFNLWTTGQAATQWVVTWGDNGSNTYTAPPGGFAVPYPVTHRYASANNYTITAAATPTTGAAVSATYALNNAFGNVTNQGETVYNPNSGHDSAGKGIAVDTSGGTYNAYIYALSVDGAGAGVTRFTPQGAVDTSFNPNGSPAGTFPISGLTPSQGAIAVSADGNWVAVAGGNNGWGMAVIDVQNNRVAWSKSALASGVANGITFESTVVPTGDFVVASGYVPCSPGTLMGALELNRADGTSVTGWNGGNGVKTISTGGTCDVATSIVDMEPVDALALAGYTTTATGSDFTLAELKDDGTVRTAFGSPNGYVRTNFGSTMGSGNGAIHIPSSDFAYALAFDSAVNLNGALVAAGYTNAVGGTHVALGE